MLVYYKYRCELWELVYFFTLVHVSCMIKKQVVIKDQFRLHYYILLTSTVPVQLVLNNLYYKCFFTFVAQTNSPRTQ